MNNPKDFIKKSSGVVINKNGGDYLRARKRNRVRHNQDETFGEKGKLAKLEQEIADMKELIQKLSKG